jgi:hypothetical protein
MSGVFHVLYWIPRRILDDCNIRSFRDLYDVSIRSRYRFWLFCTFCFFWLGTVESDMVPAPDVSDYWKGKIHFLFYFTLLIVWNNLVLRAWAHDFFFTPPYWIPLDTSPDVGGTLASFEQAKEKAQKVGIKAKGWYSKKSFLGGFWSPIGHIVKPKYFIGVSRYRDMIKLRLII